MELVVTLDSGLVSSHSGFTTQIIVLTNLIVLAAFAVRGLTGFGSGPVMVPLMLMFLDIRIAVPTAALTAVITGVFLLFTFNTRRWVRKDILLTVMPPYIVGSLLGTYVLASFKSDVLKIAFAIFIGLYALKMLWDNRGAQYNTVGGALSTNKGTTLARERVKEIGAHWGVLAGFAGGLTGGLFASGGPPVVMYLVRKVSNKSAFRATMVFMFLLLDSWRAALYAFTGLLSGPVLQLSIFLLPALLVGNVMGSFLHSRVNQRVFTQIVGLVLLALAVLVVT